ncbi:hypothetical protein [Holdemanella sp.]|uniref:hypothetical protein n=1 Tax=Holdemanella sp. TaxID=1971762 RepID=UPI003AF1B620
MIAQEQIDLEIDFHDLYEQTGIRFDLANMILEHFDRRGLIFYQDYIGGCCINLKAEIFDFFNHGGFTAQEELLQANLEKLNLELLKLSKDLEPSVLESANTITAIAGSVATALGLFK